MAIFGRDSEQEERLREALISRHGVEILRFMEARSLQVLLAGWGPDVFGNHCQVVALALVGSSPELRQLVLHNMNRVQARAVREELARLESSPPPTDKIREAGNTLLRDARKLEMDGVIVFTRDLERSLGPPRPPDPALFPDREGAGRRVWQWLHRLTGSRDAPPPPPFTAIAALGAFDLTAGESTDLIDYWISVACEARKLGPLARDAVLDNPLDGFSRAILELSLSDWPDGAFREQAARLAAELREALRWRYEAMGLTVGAIVRGEPLPALADRLNALFPAPHLDPHHPWPIPEHRQAPPVLKETSLEKLLETLMTIAAYTAANGVLSLESVKTDDPYFEQAANLAVDGVTADEVEEMMADRAEALLHDLATRQRIVIAALFGIRRGTNPRLLEGRLLSFLPLWAMPRDKTP